MIEKGFSHHVFDSGYPYDFKKDNFNFSKAAILANEYELALRMTGTDTVEGALVSHNYPLALLFVEEWNRRHPDAPIEKEFEIHQRLKEEDPNYGWDVFDIKEECEDGEDDDEPVHHQMGGYPK